jgi:MerR family transcriptional regulator, thiopeptide resistance regulator
MKYSIGQVAKLARVTVRRLHYYDQVDLLHPSERSATGYRRYSHDDLERLQRILCYRQLGFALEQIKAIIDDPETDPLEHLQRQHTLLSERIDALQRMREAVEKLMEARTMGINLEPDEMLEAFGETDPVAYRKEAEQNWGNTNARGEAQRRMATYTKDDWKRMQTEVAALLTAFAKAVTEGAPAESSRIMDLAEAHRQHLEEWFYPCSARMHCGLADLYVSDPRFTAQFDTFALHLASYLRDAIYANAQRHTTGRTGGFL